MSTQEIVKFPARSRIRGSDVERSADNSLGSDDAWFIPAFLVGVTLILFGSICLVGN